MYAAERTQSPVRVYHLSYADSLEQQRYLAAVEREQAAFTQLIEFKQHIVIPEENPMGQQAGRAGEGRGGGCITGTAARAGWGGVGEGFGV